MKEFICNLIQKVENFLHPKLEEQVSKKQEKDKGNCYHQ